MKSIKGVSLVIFSVGFGLLAIAVGVNPGRPSKAQTTTLSAALAERERPDVFTVGRATASNVEEPIVDEPADAEPDSTVNAKPRDVLDVIDDGLSEGAKIWVSKMPSPQNPGQKLFLHLLALYHDSTEEISPAEIATAGAAFQREGDELTEYMTAVLDRLTPSSDQRERNFIYAFAKTARPETSLGKMVIADWKECNASGRALSSRDRQQLAEILFSLNDYSVAEKSEIIASGGLSPQSESN